ncbi:MAG TPA: bifunctional riboflavin kinase/FAD synthetase [Steroidobacteraceae bacterium]|nr:bifunctional riboflavin kinase/FAD synthetase [Steroidobacteraceae bacterium]
MLIRRGEEPCRNARRGCVVAIGNFDGLHLGHQAILDVLRHGSRDEGLPAAVLTFEPHPREYFVPDAAPARLMRLRDKAELLAALGIDELRVLRFGATLSQWDGTTFIERVLWRAMGARRVVIGEGFRFGHGRGGDVSLLRDAGATRDFRVDEVPPLVVGGHPASSTRVREALAAGRMAEARALLGRDYRMSGRVVAGARLGRKLGFPTANMRLHRRKSPLAGIFAVRVSGLAFERRPGVASVGTRPAVGGREWLIEVHLFDFDADLYRQRLDVDFVARLRDEVAYDNLDAMIQQMHRDAARARELLGA